MIYHKTISAVVFVYNEEHYIAEMLKSILNQTCFVDQIIVVDDQSTDNTVQVVKEIAEAYPNRIHLSYNNQKGKVFAYQMGLKLVQTDLFFICAGDDVLYPSFVEQAYQELIVERQAKYGYVNYVKVDAQLNVLQTPTKKKCYHFEQVFTGIANPAAGYLFASSEVIDFILPIPPEISFEDWITAIRLSKVYKKLNVTTQQLFMYRQHGGNVKTQMKAEVILRNVKLFEVLSQDALLSSEEQAVAKKRAIFFKDLYHLTSTLQSSSLDMPFLFSCFWDSRFNYRQKIKILIRLIGIKV